jgi:diaminopimelate epimerase
MRVEFTKMQGCGNDYIYFNCMENDITKIIPPETISAALSDRHFGIGGDGIVLILPSDRADAKMRMFNLDGSEGKMCGNAIRCVAKYLYDNEITHKLEMNIDTLSGVKKLFLTEKNGHVTSAMVDMGKAELTPEKIPVRLTGKDVISRKIEVGGNEYSITCVSMGNPHAVIFCDDVDGLELSKIGPEIETNELFPERVNVEFVEVTSKDELKMRVWERGSGETLACGTGACASAAAAVLNGYCDVGCDVKVSLLGGVLSVRYGGDGVMMTGECKKVFEGIIEI